jgi:hypothetical protein
MSFDPVEVELLKGLYGENDYPSDRLIRDKRALLGFTREHNRRTGSTRSDEEIAYELERIRKDKKGTGGLPRIGRAFSGPKFTLNEVEEVVV